DEAFDAMRDDLLAKLETVFEAILTGRPEDEVYGLWREITATDVASAEQRRAEHARVVPTAEPVTADVAQAINETVTRGPAAPDGAVHCALVASPDGERAAAVLIASLLEHTRRPLH